MSTLCASFLDIGPLAVLKSKRAIQSQTRNLRPSFHWPPKLSMFQDTAVELLKRSTQRIEVCVGNAGEWPRSWSSQARWWGSPQAPLKRIQDLGLKLLVLQLQQFFWDASRLKPWSESFLLLLNLDPFIEFEVGHFRTRRITLSVRGRAHKDSWRAPCWVLETARLQTIYVLSVQFRGSMTRQSCFKDLSKHGILGSVTET